jgi:nitrate reductase gamma subunit
MLDSFGGLLKPPFMLLVASLIVIVGILFLILSFVSTTQIGEAMGIALFLTVAGLVFAGYVVGVMVLAFVAILALTRFWQRTGKK